MDNEKKVPLWYAKLRIKVTNAKATVKEQACKAVDFAKEHPEVAIATIGLVTTSVRSTGKAIAAKRERDRYEKSFYDKRTGRREWAKKKPTRTQATIINERHLAGEDYRSILADMNLLK